MMDSNEESFVQIPSENSSSTINVLEFDRLSLEVGEREQDSCRLWEEAEFLRRQLQERDVEAEAQEATFERERRSLCEERDRLLQEQEALEHEIEHLEKCQMIQEEWCQITSSLPEADMVFQGHTEAERLPDTLTALPHVRYPVPEGSALITFEDPEVARNILAMGEQHEVQLDELSHVTVKAEPMDLPLPSAVEMCLERSPRQGLVSGLRLVSLPEEQLLDKLELFFSKRQNGGGEVERVERLHACGHVVLTFVEDGVVERLVQRCLFQVPIGKTTHEVKLSHYISGKITNLQFCPSVCARTILLTGIPDVLNEELMRDALEVHFQKPSNGGGEVDHLTYVPRGHSAVAVFEGEED